MTMRSLTTLLALAFGLLTARPTWAFDPQAAASQAAASQAAS
jgi:hypothetical protein